MKSSFITTVDHNIGDDFVREGIIYLLEQLNIIKSFDLIHKHSPVTNFYGFEKIRSNRISKLLYPFLNYLSLKNRINDSDIIIQSGAPIYWCHNDGPHCWNNEWYKPLILNNLKKRNENFTFMNIAGGSCQKYHSDGSEFMNCKLCSDYIKDLYDLSDLTILRDDLAQKVLKKIGRDASVLPCTSIFARDRLGIEPKDGEYIVVNYMQNAAHYTFGQDIDTNRWKKNFIVIVKKFQKIGKTIAACHNKHEYKLIKKIMPDLETFIIPNDYRSFLEFYSKTKFAVVNRVHAGFMIASLGKPVTVIGNDTRALMINNLNLKSYFVNDVNTEIIDVITDELLKKENTYFDEIQELRIQSKQKYMEQISKCLNI